MIVFKLIVLLERFFNQGCIFAFLDVTLSALDRDNTNVLIKCVVAIFTYRSSLPVVKSIKKEEKIKKILTMKH